MITIAIATMSVNLENTLKAINNLSLLSPKICFLIVSQGEKYDIQENRSNKVTIIKSTTVGLSKSRNIAINAVNSGWIWFQDDDIELDVDNVVRVVSEIANENPDVFFVKIGSLENKNELYKDYRHYQKHSYLNFLKVSSIEIIVKKEFIKNHNIRFDESLGLGTTLPCCEENKFILDCFSQSKKILYSCFVACYHTTDLSNRNIDYIKNIRAKGYFLSFTPYWLTIALFFRWSFKFAKISTLDPFMCFKLLAQGYRIKHRIK